MTDDVSPGELDRRLEAHERRTDRIHEAMDARMTNLAKDTVPLLVYQQGERDRDKEMQQLREEHAAGIKLVRSEVKELRDRPRMTWSRWLGVLTVVAAFLTVVIEAFGTLRGSK